MATYLELKAQADTLMREAEAVRQMEVAAVIADIQAKMKIYDLTAKDIAIIDGPGKGSRSTTSMKYHGPNGQTWGGGRGRKPDWILAGLREGKKLEDFAI